jgi:hypothetical protein
MSFAQPKCDLIFDESSVITDLARLRVDIENTPNSIVRNTLNKDYEKKFQRALDSGLDLGSLTQKIEEFRTESEKQKRQDENRVHETQNAEKNLISVFKNPVTVTGRHRNFSAENLSFVAKDSRLLVESYLIKNHFYFDTAQGHEDGSLDERDILSRHGNFKVTEVRYGIGLSVEISDPHTHKFLRKFRFDDKAVASIEYSFNASGTLLATAHYSGVNPDFVLYDLKTGQPVKHIPRKGPSHFVGTMFSDNDQRLLILKDSGVGYVLDTATNKVIASTRKLPKHLRFGSISADGRFVIASGGGYRGIPRQSVLWDTATNIYKGFAGFAKMSANGKRALIYDESHAYLWDLEQDRQVGALPEIPQTILAVALNSDATQAAVAVKGSDKTNSPVRLWTIEETP